MLIAMTDVPLLNPRRKSYLLPSQSLKNRLLNRLSLPGKRSQPYMLLITLLIFFVLYLVYSFAYLLKPVLLTTYERTNYEDFPRKKPGIKYILKWTNPEIDPFNLMGVGQNNYVDWNCRFQNCYITSQRQFFDDIKDFDVILFGGPQVIRMKLSQLPSKRAPYQKYVFVSQESNSNYPICSHRFDNFFNWTWTYKLNSDLRWGYIVVRDAQGRIIGPNKEMSWIKKAEMLPVTDELKKVLRGKTKAVAWFVSSCHPSSKRQDFVELLSKELIKYNSTFAVDIYGGCGRKKCSKKDSEKCFRMLKKDYYFYLSFENSFSEDYVTEKLLTAVENNVVPIVYGGAKYSRFLPEGSYIDAYALGPKRVAAKIIEAMLDFEIYIDYFRWTNHYSYTSNSKNNSINHNCGLCELINDEAKMRETETYKDFSKWWDTKNERSNTGCPGQKQRVKRV